jgi:hypothetical protein
MSRSQSVTAPVSMGMVRRSGRPTINRLAAGDIVVSHREFITDVAGSVAFSNTQFAVNPGLVNTFPWLSRIAAQYESYQFEKLDFVFETVAATSATGTVALAIDYDASDAAPTTKTQIMSYRNAVRSPAWSNCANCSVREDLSKLKSNYVRSSGLSANQDVKLYDIGNLNIAVQGQAGTTAVGELYVEYIVRLITPQLDPANGQSSGLFAGTSNSAPAATVTGNLPVTVVSGGTTTSTTTFTFTQPYQGLCAILGVGTGITAITFTTGTCTAAGNGTINTAATISTAYATINAQIGQTFIIVVSNTTLTTTNFRFGQYLVANG